jgi:hypothetical protein
MPACAEETNGHRLHVTRPYSRVAAAIRHTFVIRVIDHPILNNPNAQQNQQAAGTME